MVNNNSANVPPTLSVYTRWLCANLSFSHPGHGVVPVDMRSRIARPAPGMARVSDAMCSGSLLSKLAARSGFWTG